MIEVNNERIELHPVQSSKIHAVGYSPIQETLAIEFQSGGVYKYSGVSEELYEQMMCASSIGKFFNEYIKGNENIDFERIGD